MDHLETDSFNASLKRMRAGRNDDHRHLSVRRSAPQRLPGAPAENGFGSHAHAMVKGITVTSNPDLAQLQSLGVTTWPTWGCGVSSFPWTYDEQETCLLLEGDVTVTPDGGEPVRFGTGDLVVFDAGLSCTWNVHAPVRKHYRFG